MADENKEKKEQRKEKDTGAVKRKTRGELRSLQTEVPHTGNPLEGDLPNLAQGLKRLKDDIILRIALPPGTDTNFKADTSKPYNPFHEDIQKFVWAVKYTKENPDALRIVLERGYNSFLTRMETFMWIFEDCGPNAREILIEKDMFMKLAARRPDIIFKYQKEFEKNQRYDEALKVAKKAHEELQRERAVVAGLMGIAPDALDTVTKYGAFPALIQDIEFIKALHQMILDAGPLWKFVIPGALEQIGSDVTEKLNEGGYNALKPYWQDLLRFVRIIWQEPDTNDPQFFSGLFQETTYLFGDDKLQPEFMKLVVGMNNAKTPHFKLGHFFRYDFSKIREIFEDEKLRPDLTKLLLLITKADEDYYELNLDMLGPMFRDDKVRPDIISVINTVAKKHENIDNALYAITHTSDHDTLGLHEDFLNVTLRPTIMSLIENLGVRGTTDYLYFLHEGKAKKEISAADMRIEDIRKMSSDARGLGDFLFKTLFPLLSPEFKKSGYAGIKKYWDDAITLVETIGKVNLPINDFRWALNRIWPAFQNDKLRPSILELARITPKGACVLMQDYDKYRSLFEDDHVRPDMMKMAAYFAQFRSIGNIQLLFRIALPGVADEMRDDQKRRHIFHIVQIAPQSSAAFLAYAYNPLKREGVHFSNDKETALKIYFFKDHLTDKMEYPYFFFDIEKCKKILGLDFLHTQEIFYDFLTHKNKKLPSLVNARYKNGKERDLRGLKSIFVTFYGLGGSELQEFVAALDFESICSAYRRATVEEKVLVARALLEYAQTAQGRIVQGLRLTKPEVDAFLATERKNAAPKLSNLFYITKAYDLLGTPEAKAEALKGIDFSKLMKEQLSIEVFGLLEELGAPQEIFEKVIRDFPLDLGNIAVVEKTREKLLAISVEKANQIIEEKARTYVEEMITPANLDSKVQFAKTWSDPEKTANSNSSGDSRFTFDIYKQAAGQMKNAIKRYCLENRCDDMESWNIFDNATLKEIRIAQRVLRMSEQKAKVQSQTAPKSAAAAPLTQEEKETRERDARVAILRQWVFENSETTTLGGVISDKQTLEARLALFVGFQQENLEAQMNVIREQVVSFINRKKGVLKETVQWKNSPRKLEDILPELGITNLETGATLATYAKKTTQRDIGYSWRRLKEKAGSLLVQHAAQHIEPGLHFESGFSGGGEQYEGKKVALRSDELHPSATTYTIQADNKTEAIVYRVDPRKGARFDFQVQVGATTKGNKGNLTSLLRGKHGGALMFDTVGAMVQGAGMPISMIFENGEPKNKKTTMEGQRDGLVIFSPGGAMSIVKKTEIRYGDLAKVVGLDNFEKYLQNEVQKTETLLLKDLPAGTALDPQILAAKNPDAIRSYNRLLEVQDFFMQWKNGKLLNYASQESYVPQDLFWMIARYGRLSGFIESLYVEHQTSMVHTGGSGAHKRLLLEFNDGTYGIYDSRIPMDDEAVAARISELDCDGVGVKYAINLDTGMADDTHLYAKDGRIFQVGYTSEPVGTNRIGIYQK